jgi:hypothetical protein
VPRLLAGTLWDLVPNGTAIGTLDRWRRAALR